MENSGTQFSVSIATPGVFTTVAAHGLTAGQEISLATSGELPTGLAVATIYIVKTVPTSTTFTVCEIPSGPYVNTTGSQSGTHQFQVIPFLMSLNYIRTANRLAVDADICDIPQFTSFIIQ